jgi:hypothetical protein
MGETFEKPTVKQHPDVAKRASRGVRWFGLSEQLRGFDKWRSAGFHLSV